ncbi:MAG: glycosyltransferase [Flavobacteriales bacterium]|nr:glycosyltransferase [Flavobacteriales bacterium]
MPEHPTCVIVGPAFPLRGGIADFNEALARALIKAGYNCKLVSFYMQYPAFLFPGKTQVSPDSPPPDLSIHSLISSINPISWWKAARFIRKQNPDLVIIRYWLPFMGPCLGTIARLIKRGRKTRIVGLTDNVIPHEPRPGDKAFTRWFLGGCHGFITLSRQVMAELQQFLPDAKVRFHPHPIYDVFGERVDRQTALKYLGLEDGKYVLFFGFIRQYKGLDLLLEAMGDERLKARGVKLIIAGEFYEPAEPYHDIVTKHKMEDRMIIHDRFIPRDDVRYYFSVADIVAQPYRTASQSGITQIAYHFERPMLVTAVGGLEEVVPHGKVGFVSQVNARSIADDLERFFDEDLGPAFATATKTEKQRFSWHSLVECIEDLVSGL